MWSEFRGDCAASREKSDTPEDAGGSDGSEILEASSSQAEER